VAERERIARELHDTLLQGFQGLMLRLQVVADRVKSEPVEAHRLIEQTLERADAVLGEGRDRVKDLRAGSAPPVDLPQAFRHIVEEAQPSPSRVHIAVEGTVRELQPIVREEAIKIGTEAITNALRHARAMNIEVDTIFEPRHFALRVSDDGIGIDPTIISAGREGHFGLAGMRERARNAGGSISIASRPNHGTEIELVIPASLAYLPRQRGLTRFLWRWLIRRREHS
jgi:signal transduction histidine kinase